VQVDGLSGAFTVEGAVTVTELGIFNLLGEPIASAYVGDAVSIQFRAVNHGMLPEDVHVMVNGVVLPKNQGGTHTVDPAPSAGLAGSAAWYPSEPGNYIIQCGELSVNVTVVERPVGIPVFYYIVSAISSSMIVFGESIVITVYVHNEGDGAGSLTIPMRAYLYQNIESGPVEFEQSQTVELGPGEHTYIDYQIVPTKVGYWAFWFGNRDMRPCAVLDPATQHVRAISWETYDGKTLYVDPKYTYYPERTVYPKFVVKNEGSTAVISWLNMTLGGGRSFSLGAGKQSTEYISLVIPKRKGEYTVGFLLNGVLIPEAEATYTVLNRCAELSWWYSPFVLWNYSIEVPIKVQGTGDVAVSFAYRIEIRRPDGTVWKSSSYNTSVSAKGTLTRKHYTPGDFAKEPGTYAIDVYLDYYSVKGRRKISGSVTVD